MTEVRLYNTPYCECEEKLKIEYFYFGSAGSYFSLLWRWRLWRTHEIRLLPIRVVNFMHIHDYNARCLSCTTKGIDCSNVQGIIQKCLHRFQLLNVRGKILMCYVGSLFVSYAVLAILQFNKHNRFDHCYVVGLWIFLRYFSWNKVSIKVKFRFSFSLPKCIAYFLLFWLIAAFSFQTVMCFDIWITFGFAFYSMSRCLFV